MSFYLYLDNKFHFCCFSPLFLASYTRRLQENYLLTLIKKIPQILEDQDFMNFMLLSFKKLDLNQQFGDSELKKIIIAASSLLNKYPSPCHSHFFLSHFSLPFAPVPPAPFSPLFPLLLSFLPPLSRKS